MLQKEMAAKLHAAEIKADIDYPRMTQKIWNFMGAQQERAFLAGIEFANKWFSIEKELPEEISGIIYNKEKYLVKYTDGYVCTTLFQRSEKRFINYRSDMSKITHWRPIF